MFDITLLWSVLPALVQGAWLTLALTAWVILLGTALSIPVALGRNARAAGLRAAAASCSVASAPRSNCPPKPWRMFIGGRGAYISLNGKYFAVMRS